MADPLPRTSSRIVGKEYTHDYFDAPSKEIIDSYYRGLRNVWLPLMPVASLAENEAKPVRTLGMEILIANMDGQIVAMPNYCPHFQARLSDGFIESAANDQERVIRCRYHGWAFNPNGQCVEIPQLEGEERIPKAAHLKTYQTRVGHDLIWVCLADQPLNELPVFPEVSKPGMESTRIEHSEWDCSVLRLILSALDDYHFAWLHEGILGTREQPKAPKRIVSLNNSEISSKFSVNQPANVTNAIDANKQNADVNYEMIVNTPNVMRIIKENHDGGLYVVHFYAYPITYNKTGLFWRVSRNYDLGPAAEERIIDMEKLIQSQDQSHISTQRPWIMSPTPIKRVDEALSLYLQTVKKQFGIIPQL